MAEETKEKWTTYLALTTVIIAVCATLSTFKGGGYSTKSLMSQSRASDKWAHYQSKSIKAYIFDMEKGNLELQRDMSAKSEKASGNSSKYNEKIADCSKKLVQYEEEKAKLSAEAKKFEEEGEACKLHSSAFGIAVIFLQISILLSSISALTKKKFVWIISLLLGAAGILYFLNGFFLFF